MYLGRGAPPIITAGTLEPAKEGLHFFMNPQVVSVIIQMIGTTPHHKLNMLII